MGVSQEVGVGKRQMGCGYESACSICRKAKRTPGRIRNDSYECDGDPLGSPFGITARQRELRAQKASIFKRIADENLNEGRRDAWEANNEQQQRKALGGPRCHLAGFSAQRTKNRIAPKQRNDGYR